MAEKILKTRFQLRHDTLAAWTSANPELKKGEIAVATIDTANPANKLNPPVMFKVGPGNFNDLDWASALAADVYAWAKGAGLPVDETEIADGEYVTGLDWDDTNSILRVKKATLVEDIATNGTSKKAATTAAVKAYVDKAIADVVAQGTVVAAGAVIDVAQEGNVYTVSHEAIANPTETAGEGRKYLTGVTTDGHGHITGFTTATEVDQVLPGEDEFGVLSVDGEKAIKVDNTDAQNPVISLALNNTGNVVLAQNDDGLTASVDLSAYRLIADDVDTNTAHTHSAGAGLVKTGDGGIDGNVEYAANIDVKYENSKIYLVDKTTNATIGEGFDASEFVKDGFLESVTKNVNDNTITFKWNTDAGITETVIDIDDLVEVYTAGEGIEIENFEISIKDAGVETKKLADKAVTEAKLDDNAVTTVKIADNAVTAAKLNADVDTHVNGLIDEKINALDVNDINGFGAGKTLATLTETDGKIAATFQEIAITESQITDLQDYALKSELPIIAADEEYLTAQTNGTTTTVSLKPEVSGRLMSALQQVSIAEDSLEYITSDNADGVATLDFTVKTKTSLGKADTAVQSVTAPVGSGLKAERIGNDITLNFDEDVIFVFDGGKASGWETTNA